MKEFKGIKINPGRVLAQVCLFSRRDHEANIYKNSLSGPDAAEREIIRFREAMKKCSDELDRVSVDIAEKVGEAEAEIFKAQKHILNDSSIIGKVEGGIRDNLNNVEYEVNQVFRSYEEMFRKMENSYLRERSHDISDIRNLLLDFLGRTSQKFHCEGQFYCKRGRNRIIIADELSPQMIATMDFTKVAGFITEHGGYSSHAAIVARSIDIPSVSGIHNLRDSVNCGDLVLLDGDNARVFLNPDDETLKELSPKTPETMVDIPDKAVAEIELPEGAEVLANASIAEEVTVAVNHMADGIGLFRTEFLFIKDNKMLTEEEQTVYYTDILKNMKGRKVVFRLLDTGGDKPLPFMEFEKEENPSLGLRGARYLLIHKDILRTQVRALAKASEIGPIGILIPMVVDTKQLREILEIIKETIK
ncbi:MAG: putative PEP-binding protein, partial [Fibrobacterota bacterium]